MGIIQNLTISKQAKNESLDTILIVLSRGAHTKPISITFHGQVNVVSVSHDNKEDEIHVQVNKLIEDVDFAYYPL